MIIQCAKNMKHLAKAAQFLVNGNSKASALLSDATLSIGLASDLAGSREQHLNDRVELPPAPVFAGNKNWQKTKFEYERETKLHFLRVCV